MAFSINTTGGENGGGASQATGSGAQQEMRQANGYPAKKDDVYYYEARMFFTSSPDWNGDFEIGVDETNNAGVTVAETTVTIAQANITKGSWATYTGTITVASAGTRKIKPMFRVPSGVTTGTVTIDSVTFSRSEPASTKGAQVGVDLQDDDGGGSAVSIVERKDVKNEFIPLAGLLPDPYFARSKAQTGNVYDANTFYEWQGDQPTTGWDLVEGASEDGTAVAEIDPKASEAYDLISTTFIPLIAGDVITVEVRIREVGSMSGNFDIGMTQYDEDQAEIASSEVSTQWLSSFIGTSWDTLQTQLAVDEATCAYVKVWLRQSATSASGTLQISKWIVRGPETPRVGLNIINTLNSDAGRVLEPDELVSYHSGYGASLFADPNFYKAIIESQTDLSATNDYWEEIGTVDGADLSADADGNVLTLDYGETHSGTLRCKTRFPVLEGDALWISYEVEEGTALNGTGTLIFQVAGYGVSGSVEDSLINANALDYGPIAQDVDGVTTWQDHVTCDFIDSDDVDYGRLVISPSGTATAGTVKLRKLRVAKSPMLLGREWFWFQDDSTTHTKNTDNWTTLDTITVPALGNCTVRAQMSAEIKKTGEDGTNYPLRLQLFYSNDGGTTTQGLLQEDFYYDLHADDERHYPAIWDVDKITQLNSGGSYVIGIRAYLSPSQTNTEYVIYKMRYGIELVHPNSAP